MIPAHTFKGQKVGVFGLGKAGEAAVASLVAGGAEVFADDDKSSSVVSCQLSVVRKFAVNCQLSTVNYVSWPWPSLSALILAPGVPKTHPCAEMAVKNNVPIMGDIELLYRSQPNAKYIAITGTNGKSTTTTLIGHILKEAGLAPEVGGNLGQAALSLAPAALYVLELSSYQLDLVHTTRFNIAVFLNITPDHLDRHGDMAGYVAAKKHIFDRQTEDDVAVIAVDDEYTREVAGDRCQVSGGAQVVQVSVQRQLKEGVYVMGGILHDAIGGRKTAHYDINNIPALTGAHNWQNAGVAYVVCCAVGVAPEVIIAAMKTFPGLRHRLQLVATINGVRFINDSKATNADAVQHALAAFPPSVPPASGGDVRGGIYWIAGGKAKAGGIESLVPLFSHIARAYLIGEAEENFAKILDGKVEYVRTGTLENAVKRAAADAFAEGRKGAVVLLSPACASFDQFTSFEHRGDVFCELVSVIPAKAGIFGEAGTSGERDSRLCGNDEVKHGS